MLLAYMLLIIAVLGASVGAIVLRADPRRWDNRIFAMMCFVDAISEAIRGYELLHGHPLTATYVLRVCHIGSIVIAYFTIEFAYSFPNNRQLPTKARIPVALGTLATIALSLHPATLPTFGPLSTFYYFFPYFTATLVLLFKNQRALQPGASALGIRLVMLSIALRWVSGMLAFGIAKFISTPFFELMLFFDATFAIFVCYVLLAYAILHFQLFRVRGFLADVVLYGGFALVMLSVLAFLVDITLERAAGPIERRVLLTLAGLVPLAIFWLGHRLLPQIEERILHPIDPHRAKMKDALARIVEDTSGKLDPSEIIASVETVLDELSEGTCKYVEGAKLEPALATQLAGMIDSHLRRGARDESEVLIPVRRGVSIFGALIIKSTERLDRDSVSTAVSIGNHLALKLENYALFSEMLELKSELVEASRLAALGQFAAGIAHDIRTPLTSVQMNVQILRGKVNLPPDDMEYFDIALDELKRLNCNISELLDYAKPVQVKKTPVDLREMVEDAARGVEHLFSDRGLELKKEHEADLPPVLVDPSRLRQVLLNLLDNAAQASLQGGAIVLRTRRAEEARIALDVCDSGKGIEPAHLAKIFEPFFTTKADGTGLGLAIAQKLVRAHGGEIKVTSTVGKGSTFTVTLPSIQIVTA
jgi:signal transduction histidine kinase